MESLRVKRILYTTDLGKHTRPVFRAALAMADQFNAEVIMLHVVEPISATAETVISTYLSENIAKEIRRSGMEEVHERLKERIKKFCEDEQLTNTSNPDAVSDILVITGSPAEEILRAAKQYNVDMIVMGKSSKKVHGRKVLGSTARRVSRYAETSVFIVSNR